MADKIRVLSKRPGQPPRSVWMTNSLKNFEAAVGGRIEAVHLAKDLAVVCNEEGHTIGLPLNCDICGITFVGDIILTGVKEEELTDLPIDYKTAKELFRNLWKEKDNGKK